MGRITYTIVAVIAFVAAAAGSGNAAGASELRGSRASMVRQNRIAKEHDYTFLRTPSQVRAFVEGGYLVPVESTEDYDVSRVSFPYTRPEVRTFIARLGAQYREATGERLVVTSLTRPTARQPRNAHPLSVHPAGMAVDLRVPQRAAAREWLERTLLSLEEEGVLDVTREYFPPHYHVAVFPTAYREHVIRQVVAAAEARWAREREDSIRVARQQEVERARREAQRAAAAAAEREAERKRAAVGLAVLLPAVATGGATLARRRRGRR